MVAVQKGQKVRAGDKTFVALVKNIVSQPDGNVTGEVKRNKAVVPVFRSKRQKIWTLAA